jgi:hypothetical protein
LSLEQTGGASYGSELGSPPGSQLPGGLPSFIHASIVAISALVVGLTGAGGIGNWTSFIRFKTRAATVTEGSTADRAVRFA